MELRDSFHLVMCAAHLKESLECTANGFYSWQGAWLFYLSLTERSTNSLLAPWKTYNFSGLEMGYCITHVFTHVHDVSVHQVNMA